jgi:hypothetical protein
VAIRTGGRAAGDARAGVGRRLGPALGLVVCALVPSLLFLGRYVVDGTGIAPAGSDTSQHVWRSMVVAELGLDALPAYEGTAQALNTNADRPGLPLVFSTLSAVAGSDVRGLAYVLPAVLAAAIALAAAALAGTIDRVPWWGVALVGALTGASVPVAFAANGYLDQLLVEPLVLAAAAGALRAAGGGRGRVLGIVALLAAWLVHWQFAALATGLLVILALACVPGSLRERSAGSRLRETAAGRIGTIAAGGTALGIASLLLGTPGIPRTPTGLSRESLDRHLGKQVARYRLLLTVPLAAVGGAALALDREASRRRAAWFLIPWALVPAAAGLAYALGRTVPLPRALSFALAIPLLAGLGLVFVLAWLRERVGRMVVAAAGILAVAALVVSAAFAWDAWRSREPWSEDRAFAEYHALGAYLAAADRPAIVVVDGRPGADRGAERSFGTVPVMRRLRAELPASDALRTFVYLGDPDRLLAGQPTPRPDVAGFDEVSRETWEAVQPLLGADPTIVLLRSQFRGYAAAVRAHPDWSDAGWVAIASGPDPMASLVDPAAQERPGPYALLGGWALSLAVLTGVGAGWVVRLGGGPPWLRLALAPAIGVALLVPVTLLAEHLGIRVGGRGGTLVAAALAGAGLVAAIVGRRAEAGAREP